MKVNVKSSARANPCSIEIKRGLLDEAGAIIARGWPDARIFIITNPMIYSLWHRRLNRSMRVSRLKYSVVLIPDGEEFKNLRTYSEVISGLLELRADRHSVIVTFGGGVVGDLGAFVAATYMRGVDLINIPTTLVAQIDSSIGGKTGVDHPAGKNMIGSFYNAGKILIDPDLLGTLPDREFIDGLFEAIKIALVSDERLFQHVARNFESILEREKNVVEKLVIRCAAKKIEIVSKDPYERHIRMILNFGHTLGHALETAGNYRRISHGEAVGWGMRVALRLSRNLAGLKPERAEEVDSILRDALGKKHLPQADASNLWDIISRDKKARDGSVHFVLLQDIGRPVIKRIGKGDFVRALRNHSK